MKMELSKKQKTKTIANFDTSSKERNPSKWSGQIIRLRVALSFQAILDRRVYCLTKHVPPISRHFLLGACPLLDHEKTEWTHPIQISDSFILNFHQLLASVQYKFEYDVLRFILKQWVCFQTLNYLCRPLRRVICRKQMLSLFLFFKGYPVKMIEKAISGPHQSGARQRHWTKNIEPNIDLVQSKVLPCFFCTA